MKKALVIVAGVIVGLLVVGFAILWYVDGKARGMAEQEAAKRITQRVQGAEGVSVKIDGFILLFDVAVRSRIEGLHVTVDAIKSHGIELDEIQLDIEGIALDRDRMLEDRKVVVTGIAGASLVGHLRDDIVTAKAKHEVVFSRGTVTAQFKGQKIAANVAVRNRQVELSAEVAGVAPLVFPLPDEDILPCDPEVEILEGKLKLSCHVDELPAAVKRAMGSG